MNNYFTQKLPESFLCIHLSKDITDDEINDIIIRYFPTVIDNQQGCLCAIYGWDFDERELCEIPEAMQLFQRLIDHGFISLLHISTLMDKKEKPFMAKFLGALEIWGILHKHIGKVGRFDIGQEVFAAFILALDEANKKVDNLLCPSVTDGQHRIKIGGLAVFAKLEQKDENP